MATKYVELRGKAKWAKVWKPDTKYDKYSIDICPDEKSREIIAGLGLKSTYKTDADGNEYMTFRRDPTHMVYTAKDVRGPAGAPKVTGVDPDTAIGNGSDVSIKLAVYAYDNKFGKGTGSRLEAVYVHELVEYKAQETSLESPF